MILDTLERADRYRRLHPGFEAGFRFLTEAEAASLADGRHEIDGDRVFALVSRVAGRGREASKLEVHRKYIDIQMVYEGADLMGWRDLRTCSRLEAPFDEQNDYAFYLDAPETWFDVGAGRFTIFFPEDAHAPLAGSGPLLKIVVKVAVAG